MIRIGQPRSESGIREGERRHLGVLAHERILHQLDAEFGQIRGAHLIVLASLAVGQTMRIVESALVETESLGPLVHEVYEGFGRAADLLCDGLRSVVRRLNHGSGQERLQRKDLPLFGVDLRTAHLARPGRDRDGRVQLQASVPDLFHGQEQGHHLGHRCRRQRRVGVVFEKHPTGGRLDDISGRVALVLGQGSGGHCCNKRRNYESFHAQLLGKTCGSRFCTRHTRAANPDPGGCDAERPLSTVRSNGGLSRQPPLVSNTPGGSAGRRV